MILATLGQQWKVRHDARHKAEMLPLISLRPKGGMPMYLEQSGEKIRATNWSPIFWESSVIGCPAWVRTRAYSSKG